MTTIAKTPYGDECIADFDINSIFSDILFSKVRGQYQNEMISKLLIDGYIQPTINLRGKAKSYTSRYENSISNCISRINKMLNLMASQYIIKSGSVGPKGGFGYYISTI